MQFADPGALAYVPALHVTHKEVSPVPVEKNPGRQAVQVDEPEASEYNPGAQSEQLPAAIAPADEEYAPAAQALQTPEESWPSPDEYEPAAHAVHADCPVWDE